jgi:glycerophosphoryl diester phosphodiesterase
VAADDVENVLHRAHAHNDYWHARPLFDALDLGYASVEADVFLVDGKLLVGHSKNELTPERTLESLYLAPLSELEERGGGSVLLQPVPITLLVDIKSNASDTYRALSALLAKYASMLSKIENGEYHAGSIEVVISGNRPIDEMANAKSRDAFIDGRLSDLADERPENLIPLVSESWTNHFQWDGRGEISNEERERLQTIVQRVHAQGKRLRFWATPETEACWQELLAADVDLIGTDHLDALATFLKEHDREPTAASDGGDPK